MATKKTEDIDLGITRLEYGDTARPQRAVLTIETSKYYNGGLISDASVYWIGKHSRQQTISMGTPGGGDYSKRLKISGQNVKATQRAIDNQHAEVFTTETKVRLSEAAKAHYTASVASGIDGYQNIYMKPIEVA